MLSGLMTLNAIRIDDMDCYSKEIVCFGVLIWCFDARMVFLWRHGVLMVEYGDLMVHRRAMRKDKDAQARDLPDVDSSWWQSSKDVSDPFAKVSNSFLYR